MHISRNNNKIAFTLIAFALASSALSLAGCGESRVDVQAGGSPALTAQQRTADIKIKFDFPDAKAVGSEVKSFEFTSLTQIWPSAIRRRLCAATLNMAVSP